MKLSFKLPAQEAEKEKVHENIKKCDEEIKKVKKFGIRRRQRNLKSEPK